MFRLPGAARLDQPRSEDRNDGTKGCGIADGINAPVLVQRRVNAVHCEYGNGGLLDGPGETIRRCAVDVDTDSCRFSGCDAIRVLQR